MSYPQTPLHRWRGAPPELAKKLFRDKVETSLSDLLTDVGLLWNNHFFWAYEIRRVHLHHPSHRCDCEQHFWGRYPGGGQFHLRTSSDRCLKGSRHFLLTELVVWVKLVGRSVFFPPLEIFLGPRKRLEIVGKVLCP